MSAKHRFGKKSPESKLLDVLIALSPIVVWSVIVFGIDALMIEVFSVATATIVHIGVSLIKKYAFKFERPVFDLSPVVTGLLLAFTLPCTASLHVVMIGSAFAIVVKELFGGMGRNPLNPALTGRALLEIAFRGQLAVVPVFNTQIEKSAISSILANELPDMDISVMFRGLMDGGIGEISALLLILGGVYLIIKGVIHPETPVVFLLAAAGAAMIVAPDNVSYFRFIGSELLTGGILLSAFFFMTDPVTTPHVMIGRIIVSALAGALSILSRIYIGYEGVYMIVLVLGLWTPLADRLFRPKVFGGVTAPKKKTAAPAQEAAK